MQYVFLYTATKIDYTCENITPSLGFEREKSQMSGGSAQMVTLNDSDTKDIEYNANKRTKTFSFVFLTFVCTTIIIITIVSYYATHQHKKNFSTRLHDLGFIQLLSPKQYKQEEVFRYWYYFSNFSETMADANIECSKLFKGIQSIIIQ